MMRKQPPKRPRFGGQQQHSTSWGHGRAIDHAPRFYDLAFEYQKLNTREARVAFTDTWLKVWANSFQETWPMIYKVLEWIEAEKLYQDAAAMESKETFSDFKSYFEARLKKPFTMWMELEQTHHYVTNFAPELIDKTWGHARAKAAEHYAEVDEADRKSKERSRPGRRTDLMPVAPPKTDLFDNLVSNNKNDAHEVRRPTTGSVARALRKLRDDAPAIHQRVLDGELTANAGMVEAGFRKKRKSRKMTILARIRKLLPKLTDDEREELRQMLEELSCKKSVT